MVHADIDATAYTTMVLHCVKYPAKGVGGLLLGSARGGKITISSVVPLVHESTPPSPSLELALAMVEAKTGTDKILGVYYSNQSYRDKGLNPYFIRLSEKIASVSGATACLAQVVNWHLSADCTTPCISVYTHDGTTWKDIKVDVDPAALTLVSSALQKQLYRDLVDFENHLDTPELDFYNSTLNRALEEL